MIAQPYSAKSDLILFNVCLSLQSYPVGWTATKLGLQVSYTYTSTFQGLL